jgi:hypothetical protein
MKNSVKINGIIEVSVTGSSRNYTVDVITRTVKIIWRPFYLYGNKSKTHGNLH